MIDPATISIEDQLACARRELAMRERVYKRGIESGKLDSAICERELAGMQAIVITLQRIANTEGKQPTLL